MLEVKDAASSPRLRRASLRVRAGEILGLAGLIGAGRTDLLRAVFALDELDAGDVCVVGAPTGGGGIRRPLRVCSAIVASVSARPPG